jgi:hypothetical protein
MSTLLAASPWAVVGLYALSRAYRLLAIWMVRTGKSDMFVDERLHRFTVRRSRPDRNSESTRPRARHHERSGAWRNPSQGLTLGALRMKIIYRCPSRRVP